MLQFRIGIGVGLFRAIAPGLLLDAFYGSWTVSGCCLNRQKPVAPGTREDMCSIVFSCIVMSNYQKKVIDRNIFNASVVPIYYPHYSRYCLFSKFTRLLAFTGSRNA